MAKTKEIVDKEETFKKILEKNPDPGFTLEELSKHSDHYWEDVCERSNIEIVYKTVNEE